jgi:hypothetical protein
VPLSSEKNTGSLQKTENMADFLTSLDKVIPQISTTKSASSNTNSAPENNSASPAVEIKPQQVSSSGRK